MGCAQKKLKKIFFLKLLLWVGVKYSNEIKKDKDFKNIDI